MTPNEKEPLKTKICCSCGIEKSIKSFYIIKNSAQANRCRICKVEGKMCNSKMNVEKTKRNIVEGPMLINVKKEDWVKTFLFLQDIGYDLKKDIHEQFCEKHNLPTRKRYWEASTIFSPKDLGLI